ncbi:MAG: hypothetical protein FJW39_20230 [Acidobacteria bacterium]|nr:hypothetical protein [Acidobacteriota bacterium]
MVRISPSCQPEPASLDQPVEHLLACHRRIEQRLETLERACLAVADRPGEAGAAVENVLRFLETNGAWHTEDEEVSILPRLGPHLGGEDREFIGELRGQHKRIEHEVSLLRSMPVTEEGFAQLVTRVCASYREHIRFEESRLPDLARRHLSAEDLAAVSGEMKRRRSL